MTIRSALLLLAVGAIAVAPAAARTSSSPKALLLKKSDMPAGAKRTAFKSQSGSVKIPRIVHGKAAAVGYAFKVGSKRESVIEAVGILRTTKDAHDVYLHLVKQLRGAGTLKKLSVRKLASPQTAYGIAIRVAAAGVLVAQSGTTVWEIAVTSFPGMTKGQLQAALSKYGAKAKARIS